MSGTDIDAFAPATAMLRALRDRQVSAVELLDLHLARIERHNPTLNAIVTPDYDAARATARAADLARAHGDDRPLLGLPLTVKDSIDVAGLRGTAGVPAFAERLPPSDAPVVTRIRAAGGVILGKTNVPPWTADWQANNPIFGRTVNPWDHGRSPGGSTGGGAAALAAGLTPLELGSDLAGSIRVPAAFCGVYGHRPSETALPLSGHFPGDPLPNAAMAMGVLGPLARSAEDLDLAFGIMAGADVGEDIGWRLAVPPPRHRELANYRVAIMPPLDWQPVDDEIVAALDQLAARLGRLGACVATTQPAGLGDGRRHYELYRCLITAISGSGQPAEERRRQAAMARARAEHDPLAAATARGLEASVADFMGWFAERERYRATYRDFFRDWDILLAPITFTLPFPHTDIPKEDRVIEVNGQAVPYERSSFYPGVSTLSGQPATAFPVSLSRAGLPIGLQAIGPYLEDRTSIHFAALVAEHWGGFRSPPNYAPP